MSKIVDDYMPPATAARRVKRDRQSIHRAMQRGTLDFIVERGRKLVSLRAVRAWCGTNLAGRPAGRK